MTITSYAQQFDEDRQVRVAALDEDRMMIQILGGKDDVRFTCTLEALIAIMDCGEKALARKSEMMYIGTEGK